MSIVFYVFRLLTVGNRPRDHHTQHRLDLAVLMVVLQLKITVWGQSYKQITVRVAKSAAPDEGGPLACYDHVALKARFTLAKHLCFTLVKHFDTL